MSLNIFKILKRRKKRNRLHFILDISLSILILILLVVVLTLNFYRPIISPITTPKPIVPEPEPEIINPLEISFKANTWGIRPGAGVLVDFDYYNFGQAEIEEINISWQILSTGFSLSNTQSVLVENNLEIVGRDLLIKNLAPDQAGQGSVKTYITLPTDPLLRQSAWRVIVSFDYLGKSFSQEQALSDLRFISNTEVKAKAYYHSPRGDQLGIGPIPPLVGVPTAYWLFFEIDNLGNDLEDFLISGRLPDYAELGDKKSLLAGNYSYDQASGRLIWQVPLVDKLGGDYRAGFEIKIIPGQEHIGSVLNLIENLSYRFSDSLCQQEISGVLPSLDTDLKDDFINVGQGTVLE